VATAKGLLSGHITFEMKDGIDRINTALTAMVLAFARYKF
jgi:hypothetical protein